MEDLCILCISCNKTYPDRVKFREHKRNYHPEFIGPDLDEEREVDQDPFLRLIENGGRLTTISKSKTDVPATYTTTTTTTIKTPAAATVSFIDLASLLRTPRRDESPCPQLISPMMSPTDFESKYSPMSSYHDEEEVEILLDNLVEERVEKVNENQAKDPQENAQKENIGFNFDKEIDNFLKTIIEDPDEYCSQPTQPLPTEIILINDNDEESMDVVYDISSSFEEFPTTSNSSNSNSTNLYSSNSNSSASTSTTGTATSINDKISSFLRISRENQAKSTASAVSVPQVNDQNQSPSGSKRRPYKKRNGKSEYKCNVCQKKLLTQILLEEHSRLHTGEKPYTCETCNKKFRREGGYKTHILVHTDEKPYNCKICNKAFRWKENVASHEKVHSKMDRLFKCTFPYCTKGFSSSKNLQTHIRIHTGEKPYQCPECKKGFAQVSNYKFHMSLLSDDIKLECSKCNQISRSKSCQRAHEKTHY